MSFDSDAQLIAAHLSGDRAALAGIYDKYADSLYDTAAAMVRSRDDAADVLQDVFVVAAERLGQLRDPARLKSWLFAILRNEVYRRTRRGRRTVATDFAGEVGDMALPPDRATDADRLEFEELAELVRSAAAGLNERDQLVLELSVRQGLEGDDLADALGVSAQQCYGLVHRMRQRTERSLGALCVARQGRKDCSELARILEGWDGEFSALVRKRVARHVDSCEVCDRSRRKAAPLTLFGSATALAAPAELRDRVLAATGSEPVDPGYGFDEAGGFPAPIRHARRLALIVTGALIVLFTSVGATVYALSGDDADAEVAGAVESATTLAPATASTTTNTSTSLPPSTTSTAETTSTTPPTAPPTTTTPPTTTVAPTGPAPTIAPSSTSTTQPPTTAPPAGMLSLSTASLDFGTSLDEVTFTLSNTGGESLDWSASTLPAPSPYSLEPNSGSLAPGTALEVTVSFDRTWPGEGERTATTTLAAPGTSVELQLSGTIERPPVIGVTLPGGTACALQPLDFLADIADDSWPISAVAEAIHRDTESVFAADLDLLRAGWQGSTPIGPDGGAPLIGVWDWTVTATDGRGNSATASGVTEVQTYFPCA